jgi:hypothetical protein
MRTLTFDAINAIADRHAADEAARNTPKAVAMRAVYTLRSALADLSEEDRAEVARLAATELAPGALQAPQDTDGLVLCLTDGGEIFPADEVDCLVVLEAI